MKNKITLIVILLAFVLLIGGASLLYNQLGDSYTPDQLATQAVPQATNPTEESVVHTIKAPDFVVYDADGQEVRLSDYFGKPIVLNFWASWCGPCQMEMPDFQEKYLSLGDEINFLIVNMTDGDRETVETASAFIEAQGYTFPVFYDTASSAAITYSVYSLPTTYFIDADGNAIAQATGAIDAETLQKGIDMIR